MLGPYGSVLLRTEAVSSSRIEQLSASARAIATVETGVGGTGGNAEVIVANARAMQSAIAAAGSLDEAAILETHRILMQDDQPSIAGKWRVEQNWIGPGNAGPRLASFVPPAHERVPALMADLVAFMHRADLPVIALVALAHAQFETIHPFIDGNGRTGRTLMHAILRDRGLTLSLIHISRTSLLSLRSRIRMLLAKNTAPTQRRLLKITGARFLPTATGKSCTASPCSP